MTPSTVAALLCACWLLMWPLCVSCGSPASASLRSPRAWSVSEVQQWLSEVVGLPAYSAAFQREAIDGEVLLDLTGDELHSALGVDKLGHRKKLEKEIAKLVSVTAPRTAKRTPQSPLPSAAPSARAQPSSTRPPSSSSASGGRAPASAGGGGGGGGSGAAPPPAGAAQFEAAAAAAAQRRKGGKGSGGGMSSGRGPTAAGRPKKKGSKAPHPLSVPSARSVHLSEAERGTVRELLRDALAAHQGGDLDRARGLYERALELDPLNARALHMLGLVVMVADSDFSGAVSLLERSLELSDDSDAHVNLANFFWQAGDKDAAMQHWEYALELNVLAGGTATRARYADTAFALAMEVYNAGDTERCKALLVQAVRLLTEADMLHYPINHHPPPYQPDAEDMRATNLALTHQIRVTLVDSWLHLGLLAEQEDDFALAVAAYNRALQVQPDPLDESKPEHLRIATIRAEVQNYRASLLGRTRDLPGNPLGKAKGTQRGSPHRRSPIGRARTRCSRRRSPVALSCASVLCCSSCCCCCQSIPPAGAEISSVECGAH